MGWIKDCVSARFSSLGSYESSVRTSRLEKLHLLNYLTMSNSGNFPFVPFDRGMSHFLGTRPAITCWSKSTVWAA